MRAYARDLRRQQLDRAMVKATVPEMPKGGWVRSIREALGMSLEAFGHRMGVTRQSANQLERAETQGTITLNRLRAAAEALNCDLVISLIPRTSLQATVESQAYKVAGERLARVDHSMNLEAQGVVKETWDDLRKRTAKEMIEKGDRTLWE